MHVFDHDQPDEIGVRAVVVKGKGDQPRQRLGRGQAVKIKARLPLTDLGIGGFEDAGVKPLFIAEVVVDHPFGRSGSGRDFVDSCAG